MVKVRRKISTSEAAAHMRVSRQRVLELLKAGRIKGAEQVGPDGRWSIPAEIVVLKAKHRGRPRKRRRAPKAEAPGV